MKTLLIDNYDSYTFNLYQMLAVINGEIPLVVTNDQMTWKEIAQQEIDNIVISPGPGTPENSKDFGVCSQVLLNAQIPVLGVCLGHQGLGYVYDAKITQAQEIMHGRLSAVYHNSSQLFQNIPQGFHVVRYHSLIVEDNLPPCLEKIAWTADGCIMALRHTSKVLWGVQFHPESVCTEYGEQILRNFHAVTLEYKFMHETILKE